jgi:D-psicose/D-tagatose/L-ribulose 3-epimerase
MNEPFRLAVCNEVFQDVSFEEACKQLRALGYTGIEIAPFTLASDPAELPLTRRKEIHSIIEGEGLKFVGLHWILKSPDGLHATTREEATRKRTWDFMHQLVDLCADLAGCQPEDNGVIVFGSPQQRSTTDGMSAREATDVLTHGLAHLAPHAESSAVKVLIEALSPDQTDVVTSLADAVCIVKQIGSPAIQTMFDTHNAVREKDSHPELVRRFLPYIRHIHVNEMDGREPGTGDYDFASLLSTLSEGGYSGWISLEAFDFSRPGREVAERSLQHLTLAMQKETLAQTV